MLKTNAQPRATFLARAGKTGLSLRVLRASSHCGRCARRAAHLGVRMPVQRRFNVELSIIRQAVIGSLCFRPICLRCSSGMYACARRGALRPFLVEFTMAKSFVWGTLARPSTEHIHFRGGQIFVPQAGENISSVRILTKILNSDFRSGASRAKPNSSLQLPLAVTLGLVLFFGLGTRPAESQFLCEDAGACAINGANAAGAP